MSESNLEKMLSELQLTTPSEQLDNRVLDCICQSNHKAQPNRQVSIKNGNRHKPLLSVAIAAALLVGIVAGFLIGQTTHPSAGNAVAELNPTMESRQSASLKSHVLKSVMTTQLAGPNVSTVCALTTFADLPQMPNTECQDCHSGLEHSINSFHKSHLLSTKFATCSLCHTADVPLKSTAAETMF